MKEKKSGANNELPVMPKKTLFFFLNFKFFF
jgi:hypothetical protein